MFDEYSKALFGEVRDSVSLLGLARPLTEFVLGLDKYARKSRRLSETTLRVRQAFYLSKSPEKLLFEELPKAYGFDADSDFSGFAEALIEALRELKGAQAALLDSMRSALCTCFRYPGRCADHRTPGTCCGAVATASISTRWTLRDSRALSAALPTANRPTTNGSPASSCFSATKPAPKWTDQDHDTADYRLAQFSSRLLDLEKLRLHHDTNSKQDTGIHEVILVKTISNSDGEFDEAVSLNNHIEAAISDARERIESVLSEVNDSELALALIARLTNDFLTGYRRSHLSKSRSESEIREVG